MSPEPKRDRAQQPRKGSSESRSARVKRELLAEMNGSYTTSELSYFLEQPAFSAALTLLLPLQNYESITGSAAGNKIGRTSVGSCIRAIERMPPANR